MDREALIHFIGGAAGGTAGTALTCPLEVIKTRLQSSKHGFDQSSTNTNDPGGGKASTSNSMKSASNGSSANIRRFVAYNQPIRPSENVFSLFKSFRLSFVVSQRYCHLSTKEAARRGSKRAIFKYISDIVKKEGLPALYKGLIPNLIGVAPSKAVYFYTYSTCKRFWNQTDILVPNSAMVHMVSAGFAGFVTATAINPVWLVKTRLQLHHGPLKIRECISRIYNREGIRGFYKGVTASYVGISETIVQFVCYEYLREKIDNMDWTRENTKFFNFMIAGGIAKFFACIVAYPHEVARTRLREEGGSRGLWKTFKTLYAENGYRTLYRGLSVQLLRSVPNTAITMGTFHCECAVGLHQFHHSLPSSLSCDFFSFRSDCFVPLPFKPNVLFETKTAILTYLLSKIVLNKSSLQAERRIWHLKKGIQSSDHC
uniref:Mitochondrial carrier protein n=1 Tax=Panagrolaimus sp. JU765 TaxID=591449 RepID=A0AC34QIE4_9BILA